MNKGFSLLELLITMVIISIISSLAVPSYRRYIRKAHYQEILQSTLIYQLGIEECYQNFGNFDYCNAGENGIPNRYQNNQSLINTINVQKGIITVTPNNYRGIQNTDTYILTPQINSLDQIQWIKSGGALEKGYIY